MGRAAAYALAPHQHPGLATLKVHELTSAPKHTSTAWLRAPPLRVLRVFQRFAAGTGLQSVITKATWYVSSGTFRVEFKPAASLVLQYGKDDASQTLVPEGATILSTSSTTASWTALPAS